MRNDTRIYIREPFRSLRRPVLVYFTGFESWCIRSRIPHLIRVKDITVLPGRAPVRIVQEGHVGKYFQQPNAHNCRPVFVNNVCHKTGVGN